MMRLTYLFHSGFVLQSDRVVLVMDYYRDPSDALPAILARIGSEVPVVFAVSHQHADHFNPEIFCLGQGHECHYVISDDVPVLDVPGNVDVHWVAPGKCAEVAGIRVEAFGSTDLGVSFVFDVDGRTVFHGGDLNDWHWQDESTPEEVMEADEAFDRELSKIAHAHPSMDVMMMAVDPRLGSDYARGARKALSAIAVGYFVPMHFWKKWQSACDFAVYRREGYGKYLCPDRPGISLDLSL